MGLSMIALGYYFYLKETTGETMEGFLLYLPIIAALSFIASFDIGLGMRGLNRKMSFNLFWYFFLFHPIDFSMYSSSRLGSQLGTLFKRSKNPGFHIRSHFQLDMCFSGRLLLSHYWESFGEIRLLLLFRKRESPRVGLHLLSGARDEGEDRGGREEKFQQQDISWD